MNKKHETQCKSVDISTRFSFYKNTLYKNIEAENDSKIKNILRICSGSKISKFVEHIVGYHYIFSFFCFIDLSSNYCHWCFIKIKSTIWSLDFPNFPNSNELISVVCKLVQSVSYQFSLRISSIRILKLILYT